jgi:hypothetical protein
MLKYLNWSTLRISTLFSRVYKLIRYNDVPPVNIITFSKLSFLSKACLSPLHRPLASSPASYLFVSLLIYCLLKYVRHDFYGIIYILSVSALSLCHLMVLLVPCFTPCQSSCDAGLGTRMRSLNAVLHFWSLCSHDWLRIISWSDYSIYALKKT